MRDNFILHQLYVDLLAYLIFSPPPRESEICAGRVEKTETICSSLNISSLRSPRMLKKLKLDT